MSVITARELALKILKEVDADDAFANLALNKILEKYQPAKLDRAFATELTYGTLRTLNTLDWLLSKFLKKPLTAQTVWIRNILRIATYQIFFMDRVPHSAACNEAVELAKKYGHQGVVKFVNGVLRNLVRNLDNIEFPDIDSDPLGHITLKYSHPAWLVKRWLKEHGLKQTVALCLANNRIPTNTVRTNTLRINREQLIQRLQQEGVSAQKTEYAQEGLRIEGFLSYRQLAAFQQGLFQIQGESSMLVGQVLHPADDATVIDVAAAPGGKATHLAQLMSNTGKIYAFDLHQHKLKLIQDNCRRLGITNIVCRVQDASKLAPALHDQADYLLLDAPCSGLGVLHHRSDAKWRKEASQITTLVKLQRAMLENVAKWVCPGGVLVYSTCTITPEENLAQVQAFLDRNNQFRLEDLTPFLPANLAGEPGVPQGFIQLWPHQQQTDGFFIARLRRSKSGA